MATRLKSRLERLEAQNRRANPFKLRIAIARKLPYDFVGERHIAPVKPLPPGTPDDRMFSFEERPGPAPAGMPDHNITVFISEDDARL